MILACSTLAGGSVVDEGGEELARLERIVLDVGSGRVAYAVLAHGGVYGLGEKLAVVPWSALHLDSQRRRFVLHMAREQLACAPPYPAETSR
jgi:sporulation protein YlmC with PRC-barrel domain